MPLCVPEDCVLTTPIILNSSWWSSLENEYNQSRGNWILQERIKYWKHLITNLRQKQREKKRKEWREGFLSNDHLSLWAWLCSVLGQWRVINARQTETHKGLCARLFIWLWEALVPPGEQAQTCLLLIPDIWPWPQPTSVRPLQTNHTTDSITIDVVIWLTPEELLSWPTTRETQ